MTPAGRASPALTASLLERLSDQLQTAQRLLSGDRVAGAHRERADRLLQEVDEALRELALEADTAVMASRFLALRSTLSAHLLAAATLADLVAAPSPAQVDALRRAADKTRAGLEAIVLTG